MGDAISAVEPSGAHGASLSLPFSKHEVVDDERAIGLSEEFAQADRAHRRITSIKVTRTFFKVVVLNGSTFRKLAAQLSDAFALTHELDFGKTKLFAFCRYSKTR